MNSEDTKCHMTKKEATLWMPRAVASENKAFFEHEEESNRHKSVSPALYVG